MNRKRSRVWSARAACAALLLLLTATRGPDMLEQLPEGDGIRPVESAARRRSIGRLLLTLRPGMTRAQVEAVVGPADDPREDVYAGENLPHALDKVYYCRLPFLPEIPGCLDTVCVCYDAGGPVPILYSVSRDSIDGFVTLVGPPPDRR